jgi:phosphoribosyl-ATP pyrophosphohydrolase/phosphoribosyl-AMP cyclohydrolase/histidinol dehydrogenase
LRAGGAQAVAAMAYGTDEVPKVDKIFGPGNQWVTAAKMLVQNDTDALVAIDMPAGPSEVLVRLSFHQVFSLPYPHPVVRSHIAFISAVSAPGALSSSHADPQVIADKTANPIFVASDLLSQAEHGTDSQVVLVAIDLSSQLLSEIESEIDKQAKALPRVEIAKQAIQKSLIVNVKTLEEGVEFSNDYAPEHLILHLEDSAGCVEKIENAGSVFVGEFSPESYVFSSSSHHFPSLLLTSLAPLTLADV